MIVILDLGLRQGCLATRAPVDGLLAADNASLLEKPSKFTRNRRFIVVGHRQVRGVPLAQHPESFELVALNIYELLSITPAKPANFEKGHRLLLFPQFLVHLMLDWKAVAVPSRNIDGIHSAHLAGLHNHVF